MIVTIGLIVFVAALNIIIVLIMMVMEKNRDIAVLMSMGATQTNSSPDLHAAGCHHWSGWLVPRLNRWIGICWVCDKYQLIRLETDVYSISHVPFRSSPGMFC